jgi:hypothetical protein
MSTPSAENIAAIYGVKKVAEQALAVYFAANGIKAYTSIAQPSTGDAAADAALVAEGWSIIDFQKDRPRVEIFATRGAGKGIYIPHPQFPAVECETAWDINFELLLITAADMRIHLANQVMVDYLLGAARGSINGVAPLTRHYLAQFTDGGTAPVEKPEEGVFQTRFNFSSMISIQRDAWSLLAT